MKTKELKAEFIGKYMPHIDNECTYPVEDEDQRVFESDLDNLLEAVAKAQRKDCANRGSHVSQQAHDYIIRTPLVTNK